MDPILTQDNWVALFLICGVIAFLFFDLILKAFAIFSMEAVKDVKGGNPEYIFKYSRCSNASFLLNFALTLVPVASGIYFGIGFFKPFETISHLILPDRILGLSLLISYCVIVTVVIGIRKDIRETIKKIFAKIII